MDLSRFIASRLSVNQKNSYSAFIVRIATAAVALSLAVMLLASSISRGYDENIREKIFGFWGNIQVKDASTALGFETKPFNRDSLFSIPLNEPWIRQVNFYATKPGLIKQNEQIHGILLKGITDDMDWSAFEPFIIAGEKPTEKNDVLISKDLAKLLAVDIGDKLRLYFIQKPMRARALKISGLYSTNMVELDEQIIYSSIRHIQQLNGWDDKQVQGADIYVDHPEHSQAYSNVIRKKYDGYHRQIISIEEAHPEIFDWLHFLKTNQWIILILMAVVAIVNMVSMILVLILERSKMIGILKALGSPFTLIRNIFLYKAVQIIFYGLLFGNLFGIGLALLQQRFQIIKLDPQMYFLSSVPISLHIVDILMLNLGTTIIILIALLLPTLMIKRINPIAALRFE